MNDNRLADRSARLSRLAGRHTKAHADYVNSLPKVEYLSGKASKRTCALRAVHAGR